MYATIPDANRLYTACMKNSNGNLRLIDPSLGKKSTLGHCTASETQVTWNQSGPAGPPGATGGQGPQGPKGADGGSVTVAAVAVGDAKCPSGGTQFTDASGNSPTPAAHPRRSST